MKHSQKFAKSYLGLFVELSFVAFVAGALYSLYAFVTLGTNPEYLLYGVWCAFAAASVRSMIDEDVWGAYALVALTLIVGVVDLLRGISLFPGALILLLVVLLVFRFINYTENQNGYSEEAL